jgi:hypothetical protein
LSNFQNFNTFRFLFQEKIFLTLANQKQELPLVAIFVGGMGRNEQTL